MKDVIRRIKKKGLVFDHQSLFAGKKSLLRDIFSKFINDVGNSFKILVT
jgi:hypothetical protein